MENKNVVSVQIDIDMKEAKKNIEELTLAVNECVAAFEKLENVMNKYTDKSKTVEFYCDGKVIAIDKE